MAKLMEIREIVTLLEGRIEALVPELLPSGRRAGHEWVEASQARGGLGSSLTVCMEGAKRGVWKHFAAGDQAAGDLLDLIAYLKFDGNKGNALRWARRWLGLDVMDAPALAETRKKAAVQAAAAAVNQARDRERRARHATAIWLSGAKSIANTPAEAYLVGRGIDLRALGRQPGALRYHPALYASEDARRHPAMLAAIHEADDRICAVHRTYLAIRPDGSVSKAALETPKMVLGPYAGGGIRLWRGERVDPETGEVRPGLPLDRAPAGSALSISEGIEDGLSVACEIPEERVLAAISVSNMAALILALPATIETVTIWAQNDPPFLPDGRPHPTAAALDNAIKAGLKSNRRVKIARAPAGYKDANELLLARASIERRDGPGSEDAGRPASRGGTR